MKICVLLLLLLSVAVPYRNAQGTGIRSMPPGDPDLERISDWSRVKSNIDFDAKKAANVDCSASVDLTYAYFLLGDLLTFHKVTGIIAYGYPRRTFYEDHIVELREVASRVMSGFMRMGGGISGQKAQPKVVFCAYDSHLVCVQQKCTSCDALPADVDPKLRTACGWKGDGGKEAEQVAPKEGDVVKRTEPEKPKKCNFGWLKAADLRERLTQLGVGSNRQGCITDVGIQKGFHLLERLVKTHTEAGALEAEIDAHRDFYEDSLWMFQGGNYRYASVCSQPKVCGVDRRCVACQDVANAQNAPPHLVDLCAFERKLPESYVKTCEGEAGWEVAPGQKPKLCHDGWLKIEDVRKWRSMIIGRNPMRYDVKKGEEKPCTSNTDVQRAWFVLKYLIFQDPRKKAPTAPHLFEGDELNPELRKHSDFYEDNLWVFRGDENLDVVTCRDNMNGNQKAIYALGEVCGMDGKCAECKSITNKTPELRKLCEFELRPENFLKTCGSAA